MTLWRKKRRTPGGAWEGLVKVRGGSTRELADAKFVNRPNLERRIWTPRAIRRRMAGSPEPTFTYTGHNRGDFFRWIRDTIPIVSAGVWAWVRLAATPLKQIVEGAALERERAVAALGELNGRVLETPFGRGSGLIKLTEAHFLELFTTGKFAGEAVLTPGGDRVDHFRFIDPFTVEWEHDLERGWTPLIRDDEDGRERVDPERFFYATLGTDLTNPSGVEPLASIPFVVEIEQMMIEDMARSGHNAGTPRLQIKIARPEQGSWEGDPEYTERANRYFQDIVREFRHLEPDDNIFTWSDVEVTVVGQGGVGYAWRLNREQVIEDVITGLKLFPWVLGRTHKATQHWVRCQYDLLMAMVQSHQMTGADLIDWLCNLELELRGIDARVTHRFDNHPDPFRLERARAMRLEIENIDLKVRRGYISKEQGAREMGYPKTFRKDENDDQRDK